MYSKDSAIPVLLCLDVRAAQNYIFSTKGGRMTPSAREMCI
jgi:hypothetical protein